MAYGNDGLGATPRRAGKRPNAATWKVRGPRTGAAKMRPEGTRLFKRPVGAGVKPEGVRFGRRAVSRTTLGDDGAIGLPSLTPTFRPNFIGIGSEYDGLGGLFSKKKKVPAKSAGPAPIDVRARGQTYSAPTLNYAVDKKGIARDLTTGQSISGKEVTARAQAFAAQTGQAVAAAKKVKKNIFQKIGGTVKQAAKNIAKNPLKNLVLPVVGAAVAGVAVTKGVKAIKAASAAKKLGGAAKKAADVAKDATKKKSKLDLLKKGGGVGLTIAGIAARGKGAKGTAIESAIPLPEPIATGVDLATGIDKGFRRRFPVNVEPTDGDMLPPIDAGPSYGAGPSIERAGPIIGPIEGGSEPSTLDRIQQLIADVAPKAPDRAASIAQTATDLSTSPSMFRDAGMSYSGGGGGGGGLFSGGSPSPSPLAPDVAAQAADDTIFGMPKMVVIGVGLAGAVWFATRKRRKGA